MVGSLVAAGTAVGMGAGLHHAATEPAPAVCGGSVVQRWPVKVGTDDDAIGNKVALDPGNRVYKVSELNQEIRPEALDAGGRMGVEEHAYTVHGYLSYFTLENGKTGDQDYHVVIADKPGDYTKGKGAATGDSMVVEFPNPSCFPGKHPPVPPRTSPFGQKIAEARATFEDHLHGIPKDVRLSQQIPVTVTGVGFFDEAPSNHLPTGHSTIWQDAKGKPVVLELHPVIKVAFDQDPEVD